MPELPEVEIVRRGLAPVMAGQRFVRIEQRRPDLRFPLPDAFGRRLAGQEVQTITRRAKYLLAHLAGGNVLLMHLGMTGRLSVSAETEAPRVLGDYVYDTGADQKHDHVVFHMTGGAVITYNDPRRFGFILLIGAEELRDHPLLCHLGGEPLDPAFTADALAAKARGRKTDLKAFLLDQRVVAGLGNIYVCEALHRARLSPRRAAATLAVKSEAGRTRTAQLVQEIRAVLAEAIAAGGSTLNDYRHADGKPGAFQESHLVYDREGAPCLSAGCGGTVRRIVQGGRSTFFCPACQR